MKPIDFRYVRAHSIDEALLELADGEGKVLAGGQSLMPLLNMRLSRPQRLVDITRIPRIDAIDADTQTVRFGAGVRQRQAEMSLAVRAALPLVSEGLTWVGHVPIRNRGTIVGSIAHADPSAELPLVALLYDAVLDVRGSTQRSIAIGDFYFGYLMTDLAADECIAAVEMTAPVRGARRGTAFLEMARRHGDFALVSAAAHLEFDVDGRVIASRVGAGGVAPSPLRLIDLETALVGRRVDASVARELAAAATRDLEPDGDIHASASYRRGTAAVLIERVLVSAADRARAIAA